MGRRKPGELLPIETAIIEVAMARARSGDGPFHGFAIAHELQGTRGSGSLTAHGTLYKALSRLEHLGLLTSRWEDPRLAEGRPRRRFYELTGAGVLAAEQAAITECRSDSDAATHRARPRFA